MNRVASIRIASAVAIASALAVTPVVAPAATATPTTTTTIMFDQLCVGLTITLPSAGTNMAGTLDGGIAGCQSGPIFGTAVPSKSGKYGLETSTEYVSVPIWHVFIAVRKDHTFTIYAVGGDHIGVQVEGTWSFGSPDPNAPPLVLPTEKGPTRAATPTTLPGVRHARTQSTKQFSFDGHCDGMELTSPSKGLGTKGTVDGRTTGCSYRIVIGAKARVQGEKGSYAVSYDSDDGFYLQTLIFKNHTWMQFATNGSVMYIREAGRWSKGPPPAAARDLPPSTAP